TSIKKSRLRPYRSENFPIIGTLIATPNVYNVIDHAPHEGDTSNELLMVVRAVLMIPLSRPAINTPIVKSAIAHPCDVFVFLSIHSPHLHPIRLKKGLYNNYRVPT